MKILLTILTFCCAKACALTVINDPYNSAGASTGAAFGQGLYQGIAQAIAEKSRKASENQREVDELFLAYRPDEHDWYVEKVRQSGLPRQTKRSLIESMERIRHKCQKE